MVLRGKLSGNRIGVVFGTFAPMHTGHMDLVHKAKKQNDGVIVIVSGYKGDRGDLVSLGLDKRFNKARRTFEGDSMVQVYKLDEEGIPNYPEGWDLWLNKVDVILQGAISEELVEFTFYVGEDDYVKELNERRPLYKVVKTDRSINPISATKIRNNPLKYFKEIAPHFRDTFSQNYLVVGAASSGKTELLKDLSRYFTAPLSLEFAREHQQRWNKRDEELDFFDYANLFTGQYNQTSLLIESPLNNGIILADTNSTVTMAYVDYFLKDSISEAQYQSLYELYKDISQKERWFKIYVVLPKTKFVDDGYRDMGMAEDGVRDEFVKHLINYFNQEGKGNQLVIVDGNYIDDTPYYANYQQIKDDIINNFNDEFIL